MQVLYQLSYGPVEVGMTGRALVAWSGPQAVPFRLRKLTPQDAPSGQAWRVGPQTCRQTATSRPWTLT